MATAAAMEGVPLEVPIWLRSRAEKPKERYLNDVHNFVMILEPSRPLSCKFLSALSSAFNGSDPPPHNLQFRRHISIAFCSGSPGSLLGRRAATCWPPSCAAAASRWASTCWWSSGAAWSGRWPTRPRSARCGRAGPGRRGTQCGSSSRG